MSFKNAVVNSSPLIVLFRSGLSDLLPRLFASVIVPDQVFSEVVAGGVNDSAAKQLPNVKWPERCHVSVSSVVLGWNLGAGESAVIEFAVRNSDHIAVIDDLAARRCAKTLGIPTIGTGGLLVLAKRRGLLASVADAVRLLCDNGLYLSNAVFDLLLEEAGEC